MILAGVTGPVPLHSRQVIGTVLLSGVLLLVGFYFLFSAPSHDCFGQGPCIISVYALIITREWLSGIVTIVSGTALLVWSLNHSPKQDASGLSDRTQQDADDGSDSTGAMPPGWRLYETILGTVTGGVIFGIGLILLFQPYNLGWALGLTECPVSFSFSSPSHPSPLDYFPPRDPCAQFNVNPLLQLSAIIGITFIVAGAFLFSRGTPPFTRAAKTTVLIGSSKVEETGSREDLEAGSDVVETPYLRLFRLALAFLLGLGFALMVAVGDYLVVGNLSIVAYLVPMGPAVSAMIVPLWILKMRETRPISKARLLLMSGLLFAVLSLITLSTGLSLVVNQSLVLSQTIATASAGSALLLAAITLETLAVLNSTNN